MNKSILFYDTKPYDKYFFDKFSKEYGVNIDYLESKLNEKTAKLAKDYDVVCAFVNDTINEKVINILSECNVKLIAMRCAGYNNVDIKAAYGKIHIVRVPAYSPYAVAEYAMTLLLTLNRKTHKAYNRIKEHNFSLVGLTGFDLYNKTIGVIGTGKIGRVFIDICKGFKANVIAYDPYPNPNLDINYVSLDELYKNSDIISLHCPLTSQTHHIINQEAISKMKDNVIIINTSRGSLIDSNALLNNIKSRKIGGVALDVYEEESDIFYALDRVLIIQDEILTQLISMPNVLLTSHQAFLTKEALENIAQVTLKNIEEYFAEKPLENEICYHCGKDRTTNCRKNGRCF